MFKTTLRPSFFWQHQAMLGVMSGFFLGLVANSFIQLLGPEALEPKYPTMTLVLVLCIFLLFLAHFVFNGHMRLIGNDAKLNKMYGFDPSTRYRRIVRVMFWVLFALGLRVGSTAQNKIFFWPN